MLLSYARVMVSYLQCRRQPYGVPYLYLKNDVAHNLSISKNTQ